MVKAKSLWKDKSGQVGTIFELVIVVFVVALAYIAVGYAADLYIENVNSMGLIMSQYRLNAVNAILMVLDIFIVLTGLVLIGYVIKVAADRRARQVI